MNEHWPSSKLDRAQQNLDEFNAACVEFIRKNPYIVTKQQKDQRRQRFRFDPTPSYLGLIFGDFVHNIRSALDHIVFELTSDNRVNMPRKVVKGFLRRSSFPIITDPIQWEADPECSNGGLDRVGGVVPDGIAEIERLQPFNGTHDPKFHPLALLAQLDNRDKHRQLVTTVIDAVGFHGETAPGHYWFAPAGPTRKNRTEPSVTVPVVEMDAKAFLAICLSQASPAPGAFLWLPDLPKLVEKLTITDGVLFPDFLLASVTGAVALLRSFLRR